MARRFRRGRSARRRSYWVELAVETSGTNVASNVVRDNVMFAFGSVDPKADACTIVRMVGGVYLGIQASPTFVASVYFGIYKSLSGSASVFRLSPSNNDDVGAEQWLHWRVVHEFQADLVHHRKDDELDVKVMRKLNGGEEIRYAGVCTVAWHNAVNIRGLFLAT